MNRLANPWVRLLLTSPLHGLVSRRLALITVTGRRSGHEHTFPVAYTREGELVRIGVGWPERKRWWRNLEQSGQPVKLRLAGVARTGRASLQRDDAAVTVEVRLDR